jgi:hypothetical protein
MENLASRINMNLVQKVYHIVPFKCKLRVRPDGGFGIIPSMDVNVAIEKESVCG